LLRADLERREPGEVPRLHSLAAEWYAAHDDPEAAVVHCLAAGDVTHAVDLAKDACARLHRQEPGLDVGLSVRLLRLIDDRYLKRDPALTLMAGWCLGLVGGDRHEQRHWGPAACRVRVGEGACEAGAASWRSYQAILRCYLGLHGVSRMLEDAELGWQLEADSGSGWRLEAASALGLARYLSGRGGAAELLEAAATGDWDKGDRAWAWGMLSLVHADECHWQSAAEADHQAVDVEAESNLGFETSDSSPAVLAPVLAHARILSRRRDPDVRAFLEEAERYVGRMVPQADYSLLLAAVILGETWLEQDDLAQAGRWRDQARTILRRYPDAGMLGPRTQHLAQAIQGRRFHEPLTPAEKRVLELLPTHLTAEQIAERLHLSANTVRTHVQSIHRKLAVAKRAEAVAKARELGLLSVVA
jgi:LuxR family maltose regulon positive regulatory protein